MPGSLQPGELEARSRELEASGAWDRLVTLLASADRDRVLDRRSLSYRLGRALYHTGRMEELDGFAGAFEARARERADATGVLQALNLAGTAAFELGRTEAARERYERLGELAEAERDEEMLGRSAHNLGMILLLTGRIDRALASYRMARTLYEKLGLVRPLAQLEHNLGIAHRDRGRLEAADEAYRRALELAEDLEYPFLQAMATVGRAEARLLAGDSDFALRLVERGLRLADRVGDPVTTAEALRVRALVRAERSEGDEEGLEAALDDASRAGELARETGNRLLEAEADREAAGVLARLGRSDEAGRRLSRSARTFDELGAAGYADEARRRLEDPDPG